MHKIEQRLATRIDHEGSVSDRMPWRVHRLDTGDDFLTVFIEENARVVRERELAKPITSGSIVPPGPPSTGTVHARPEPLRS
jgi:hypothetical protein